MQKNNIAICNRCESLQKQINTLQKDKLLYQDKLKELRQRSDIHYALNEILNVSLLPISLHEILEQILVLLLDIPWLALNRKGAIFLVGSNENVLDLIVEYNLGPILQKKCAKVPFGTCLCGLTAQTEQMVFKSCIDDDHHYQPKGMQPHGHYCIPIKWRGKLKGILNLYVEHDHQSTLFEQDFLNAVSQQ